MVKFNFQYFEEKRLSAKLLTILTRDYRILKTLKKKYAYEEAYNEIFRLTIQNFVLAYPVYNFFISFMD